MSKKKVEPEAEKSTPAPTLATDIDAAVAAMDELGEVEDPTSTLPEGFDPDKVPDINTAREDAKIPEHKRAGDMLDKPLVFVSWRPQRGFLASTGEYRPGFFCVVMDASTKKVFTVWIGQVALYKELKKLKPPFRARIVKSGRTLVFS